MSRQKSSEVYEIAATYQNVKIKTLLRIPKERFLRKGLREGEVIKLDTESNVFLMLDGKEWNIGKIYNDVIGVPKYASFIRMNKGEK